jgi:HK97 family phage major capsid protein
MTRDEIKALREKFAKLVHDQNDILKAAATEGRAMTPEENDKWTKIDADSEGLRQLIERGEKSVALLDSVRSSDLPASLNRRTFTPTGMSPAAKSRTTEEQRAYNDAALRRYIAGGFAALTEEQRSLMVPAELDLGEELRDEEGRALSQVVTTAGGNLVPQNTSMFDQIVQTQKAYGLDERALFTVLDTDDTGDMPIPTNDDTSNSGSSQHENVDAGTATDPSFSQITLYSHLNTTGMLLVSNKLLRSGAAAEQFIGQALGTRIGRRRAAQFTTGTGTAGQAQGLVVGSTLGKTTASASAITFLELMDLKHSVDPAYRLNARWMMNDAVWLALKKLVDSQGRPLYQANYADGAPATLDGQPITINQNMATIATTQKTVLYGDFKKYVVRNTGGLIIARTTERYIEKFQTGFIIFYLSDARLTDTAAVKHLLQT